MWSPELETLDQLLSGDLSLTVIRELYPDNDTFLRGVHSLLQAGDARLMSCKQLEVPKWRFRELFLKGTVFDELAQLVLQLTALGARRVA